MNEMTGMGTGYLTRIGRVAKEISGTTIKTLTVLGGIFLFTEGITSCSMGVHTKQWHFSNQKKYCILSDQIFGDNPQGYGFGSYVVSRNKKPLADLNDDGLVSLVEKIEMYRRAGIYVNRMKEFPVLTLEQLQRIKRSFPVYLTAPNQAELT